MKKIFILFLFTITACGYQPLYKITDSEVKFKIKEIELIGNEGLSKKISSRVPLEIIKTDITLNKLIIDSKINIEETTKNSKGQVSSYRTKIILIISIQDNQGKLIKKKTLVKEFAYNTQDNKFKLKQYQDEVEKNLIGIIAQDVNVYLNF